MNRFDNPFIERADVNFDAMKKAKEMRNKSKIPRVRTMKKIMKRIKEAKVKQELKKSDS